MIVATLLVTRYRGAGEWFATRGLEVDSLVARFDPGVIEPGDIVIGTLPINVAAELCQRSVRYPHLSQQIPPKFRGVEHTAEQIDEFGTTIEEFRIERIP